eukprot:scaffold1116_cov104-Amphora_coffeaeformis.AAC.2
MDYINRDMENPVVWKYKRILSHEGPLKPGDKGYNGSTYNIMLESEDGEVTAKPLTVIAKDDPVTCAIYAKENNLLELDGWKRFKPITRREKKFIRMAKQAYLRCTSTGQDCWQQQVASVITHSSSTFVHMGSPIYSHFDNPVQDYSPNEKSRQTKVRSRSS